MDFMYEMKVKWLFDRLHLLLLVFNNNLDTDTNCLGGYINPQQFDIVV